MMKLAKKDKAAEPAVKPEGPSQEGLQIVEAPQAAD